MSESRTIWRDATKLSTYFGLKNASELYEYIASDLVKRFFEELLEDVILPAQKAAQKRGAQRIADWNSNQPGKSYLKVKDQAKSSTAPTAQRRETEQSATTSHDSCGTRSMKMQDLIRAYSMAKRCQKMSWTSVCGCCCLVYSLK